MWCKLMHPLTLETAAGPCWTLKGPSLVSSLLKSMDDPFFKSPKLLSVSNELPYAMLKAGGEGVQESTLLSTQPAVLALESALRFQSTQ